MIIEKDCDNWKKIVTIGKACDKKRHISNINKFSSNVNEVTRAVLNSLFFFTKRFHMHQRHKRHKMYKDATKQKYKKTQNEK